MCHQPLQTTNPIAATQCGTCPILLARSPYNTHHHFQSAQHPRAQQSPARHLLTPSMASAHTTTHFPTPQPPPQPEPVWIASLISSLPLIARARPPRSPRPSPCERLCIVSDALRSCGKGFQPVFFPHAVSCLVIPTEMAGFFFRAASGAPAMAPDLGFRRCYRNGGIPANASTPPETEGEKGNQHTFRIGPIGTFVNEGSYLLSSPAIDDQRREKRPPQ